jgi:hypothetical protein
MKTITQSIGTRQIVSLVFSILLMANANSLDLKEVMPCVV